jgi:hypothetical protein
MAVLYPDADIILSGHTHDAWIMPIKRFRISNERVPFTDLAWHVRTPTYKDEFVQSGGWAYERGHNPKPLGCAWIRFFADRERKVAFEVIGDVR